jgi:hypothetical protein
MFAAGLLLLLAGFGNVALAAGVTPFAMPSGDATVTEVLAPIFGEAVGGAGAAVRLAACSAPSTPPCSSSAAS